MDWKRRGAFLIAILLLLFRPAVASADMGPKPYVKISFCGMEDQTYYVALLAENGTGPWWKQ